MSEAEQEITLDPHVNLANWSRAIYFRQREFQTQILKELQAMSAEFDALKTQVEAALTEVKTLKDAATANQAALADAAADKAGMAALTTEVAGALAPPAAAT